MLMMMTVFEVESGFEAIYKTTDEDLEVTE